MRAVMPADGPVRLGSVKLPEGRRLPLWPGAVPRLWVTSGPVPRSGELWQELSAMSRDTGLVPIVLAFLDGGSAGRPWDNDELGEPGSLESVDQVDVAGVLADNWRNKLPADEPGDEFDEDWAGHVAPYGLRFPGLARGQEQPLSGAELTGALGWFGPARIGLVPAERPADVVALIGHTDVSHDPDLRLLTAVLRSWEDRFGAILAEVGFAHIRLLARRPPRTLPDAQAVAAEIWAMCDEFWLAGQNKYGLWGVSDIAEYILSTPIWSLWLD
jgi:hypothetical protein